jgi:hypothetical protein
MLPPRLVQAASKSALELKPSMVKIHPPLSPQLVSPLELKPWICPMPQHWSPMPSHRMPITSRCAAGSKQYCSAATRSAAFAGVVAGAGGGGAPSQNCALPPQQTSNPSSSSRLPIVLGSELLHKYLVEQFACVKLMYKIFLTS